MRGIPALLAASGVAVFVIVSLAAPASTSAARTPARASSLVSLVHGARMEAAGAHLYADSQSDNWSGYGLGYLSTSTLYTSISGTWVVPTAKQETKGQAEDGATWIGIGGGCYNTSCTGSDETLIQAGTEEDVSAKGKASYSAWYELIPETSTTESIKVHPGDVINCSITETSTGEWTITLTDKTDKQHFTESTAYPSDESTAEWIVETPVVVSTGGGTGIADLPNLGKVKFTDAKVNGKGAGLVPADAIQLVNSDNKPLATPSKPTAGGTAFVDCTYASSCKG
jgi:Peptidase A4 family